MNTFELAAVSSLGGGALSGAIAGMLSGGIMGAACGLLVGFAFGVGVYFGMPYAACRLFHKYAKDSQKELIKAKQYAKIMSVIPLSWACVAPFISILFSASFIIAVFS